MLRSLKKLDGASSHKLTHFRKENQLYRIVIVVIIVLLTFFASRSFFDEKVVRNEKGLDGIISENDAIDTLVVLTEVEESDSNKTGTESLNKNDNEYKDSSAVEPKKASSNDADTIEKNDIRNIDKKEKKYLVTVIAPSNSKIFIDSIRVGTGSFKDSLKSGIYEIVVEIDNNHWSDEVSVVNKNVLVNITPEELNYRNE